MQYSKDGLELTKHFESCRLVAYQDTGGVWTLGWGHIEGVKEGDTCTQEQADAWLIADIQRVVDQVNRDVKMKLSQEEFDAVIDFGYNLGVHALEHSTLWKLLQAGDLKGAADQFPRWNKDNGKVLLGLVRRRAAERTLFLQGT